MTRSQFILDLIAKHGADAPLSACYAQLFNLGELLEMVQAKEQPDPRIARRESILVAFQDEPLTKQQAESLIEELAEIDQALQFNPSDSLNDFIGANWNRMEDVEF